MASFWVHNDSGDRARIYAIDQQGRLLAALTVTGVQARDWEDMAAFQHAGQRYLICGDIGDNKAKRRDISVTVVEEPVLPVDQTQVFEATVPVAWQVRYQYPEGARDAEGLAFDPASKQLLVLSKRTKLPLLYAGDVFPVAAEIFENVDGQVAHEAEPENAVRTLQFLAELPLPAPSLEERLKKGAWAASAHMPTAMDIDSEGLAMLVSNYVAVWYVRRSANQSWVAAWTAGTPVQVPAPVLAQTEAICFSNDQDAAIITTEQLPAPLLAAPLPIGDD
jgi:hypothetical protein